MARMTNFKLSGVTLFASGGRWSPAQVRQMAVNAKRLGPSGEKMLLPPAVLEEDRNATDAPASGWLDPDSVQAIPDPHHPCEVVLKGDVVGVPAEVKSKLDSGEYRFGDAETYESFRGDLGKDYGPALRRICLLRAPQGGRPGALPRVVEMTQPMQFSERGMHVRDVVRGGLVYGFAERVGGRGGPSRAHPDRELLLVQRFAEEAHSELVKFGESGANIVERFQNIRKHRPDLTAVEYLGRKAVERFSSAPTGRPSRAQILDALKQAMPGISISVLKALDDEKLLDLLMNLPVPL